jgi:Flp pilus assembly protein TadG
MRRTSKGRSRERGSQVVELAVALPLLMFLAFLVSEVAALVRVHQVINNAAREGARVAVLDNANSANPTPVATAAVTAYVNTYVPAACAPGSLTTTVDPNVTMMTAGGRTLTATKVTVNCNYQWVTFKGSTFWWLTIPATIPLKGTATFQNLYG